MPCQPRARINGSNEFSVPWRATGRSCPAVFACFKPFLFQPLTPKHMAAKKRSEPGSDKEKDPRGDVTLAPADVEKLQELGKDFARAELLLGAHIARPPEPTANVAQSAAQSRTCCRCTRSAAPCSRASPSSGPQR